MVGSPQLVFQVWWGVNLWVSNFIPSKKEPTLHCFQWGGRTVVAAEQKQNYSPQEFLQQKLKMGGHFCQPSQTRAMCSEMIWDPIPNQYAMTYVDMVAPDPEKWVDVVSRSHEIPKPDSMITLTKDWNMQWLYQKWMGMQAPPDLTGATQSTHMAAGRV